MELQGRLDDIKKQGLGLIALSYDSIETLKKFADSRGITFPMVSDQGSAIIKRYGLLNETVDPKTRAYGVPYPGTLIVDRKGVVQARFFEDAYQERVTAGNVLVQRGSAPLGVGTTHETAHITVTASPTDRDVAPGKRISIVFDVTPKRGIHVYAPGKHDYRVVSIVLEPQTWLKTHPVRYPPSQVYDFKPLKEKVEVYMKPFRLVQDVTILATADVQKQLSEMTTLTISGRLSYQACDDNVCFSPTDVPIQFTLNVRPLDRKPAGGLGEFAACP